MGFCAARHDYVDTFCFRWTFVHCRARPLITVYRVQQSNKLNFLTAKLHLCNCLCVSVCLCANVSLQENLLQSVLPVYISMKMKLAIMERLQDCKDKEEQQRLVKDNNFHSLYVKRHENVRYNHNPSLIIANLFKKITSL